MMEDEVDADSHSWGGTRGIWSLSFPSCFCVSMLILSATSVGVVGVCDGRVQINRMVS